MKRFTLTLAALALLSACSAGGPQAPAFRSDIASGPTPWTRVPQPAPDELRFAVIGDRTGLARPGVFEQAMRQIGWMHPEMVLTVGDLIEGYTADRAQLDAEWRHIDGAVRAAGLPFVFVPGNHDIGNDVMLEVWRQRFGRSYFHFVYKDALFLCLDTEDPPMAMPADMEKQFHDVVAMLNRDPAGFQRQMRQHLANANSNRELEAGPLNQSRFSDAQAAYVEDVLKRHPNPRWTFVLMHKPGWRQDSGNFARIEKALAGRPYTMIAGHYHYFTHEVRNGRDYFAMGTTGGISHQEGPGKMDHIAWVTLTAEGPKLALVRLDGILDTDGRSGQPAPVP